jgi:hypothetical protein
MIALEKDGSILYQGSWTRRLQEMVGLRGNSQPSLPHVTSAGTLRNVEYVKPSLLKYQCEGSESGKLEGAVWKLTVGVKDLSLDQSKEQALKEICSTRYNVECGGVLFNSKWYCTNREAQNAIANASGTVNWKCCATVTRSIPTNRVSGDSVDTVCISEAEFVSTDMAALQAAVKKHVADAYEREATLMTAIKGADSLSALRAIDLTAGWAAIAPSDPGE